MDWSSCAVCIIGIYPMGSIKNGLPQGREEGRGKGWPIPKMIQNDIVDIV